MSMRAFSSVLVVVAAVLILWLAGQMFGFHIALLPSLLISIVATLVLTLGMRALRR